MQEGWFNPSLSTNSGAQTAVEHATGGHFGTTVTSNGSVVSTACCCKWLHMGAQVGHDEEGQKEELGGGGNGECP